MLLKCKFCGLTKETTRSGMSYHENRCKQNPNRKEGYWAGKNLNIDVIKRIGKHNRMGQKNPNSILELSKRTVSKILHRMDCGCSMCGWNLGTCDMHHIIPKSKGGSNDNTNLSILCPNCHRLVHNGKIKPNELKSIKEQLGDSWKQYYYGLCVEP